MPDSLKSLKPKIVIVLKRHGISQAGVFGSYATGAHTEKSDIDILVKFKGRKSLIDLANVELDLEKALKRKVDLLTYNSISPLIRKQVLKEEVRIL